MTRRHKRKRKLKWTNKPGPVPKEGERYPSGDLKPDAVTAEVISIAVEYRRKHFGLSKDDAPRAETGCAIGRLVDWKSDKGDLTQVQYQSLVEYHRAHHEYQRALDVKRMRSSSDYSGVAGYDGSEGDDPEYVERCERAKKRFQGMRRAALEATFLADMALQQWVLEDREAWSLLGELRLAANAIGRLIGIIPKTGNG